MTYIVDTHILIWFLDKNKRLKPVHQHTSNHIYNSDSRLQTLDIRLFNVRN